MANDSITSYNIQTVFVIDSEVEYFVRMTS